jgi:hypothetical protein
MRTVALDNAVVHEDGSRAPGANGIASFYGGSAQVHLGPGPGVDEVHARSLRAALITGGTPEITDPGESETVTDSPNFHLSFSQITFRIYPRFVDITGYHCCSGQNAVAGVTTPGPVAIPESQRAA